MALCSRLPDPRRQPGRPAGRPRAPLTGKLDSLRPARTAQADLLFVSALRKLLKVLLSPRGSTQGAPSAAPSARLNRLRVPRAQAKHRGAGRTCGSLPATAAMPTRSGPLARSASSAAPRRASATSVLLSEPPAATCRAAAASARAARFLTAGHALVAQKAPTSKARARGRCDAGDECLGLLKHARQPLQR